MITTDNEDFYEMVNRDISPDDLGDIGKAFRDQKIKIYVKSDEDLLSEGNGQFTMHSKESVNHFFSKQAIRKAN